MLALTAGCGAAGAAASHWHDFEGGRLRVVLADAAEANGTWRGALEIDLKPGWKTYWLDPGDSGVPPSVELAGTGEAVALAFPAPARFGDGTSSFAGYDRPVAIALTFSGTAMPHPAEFGVFIGVCETICVPVQALLRADQHPASSEDAAAVAAAFSALPGEATADFGVRSAWSQGDELVVEVTLPGDGADGLADAELFVASTQAYPLGEPRADRDGRHFHVPMLDRPADPLVAEDTVYTLVAGGRAVSGTLTLARHP